MYQYIGQSQNATRKVQRYGIKWELKQHVSLLEFVSTFDYIQWHYMSHAKLQLTNTVYSGKEINVVYVKVIPPEGVPTLP